MPVLDMSVDALINTPCISPLGCYFCACKQLQQLVILFRKPKKREDVGFPGMSYIKNSNVLTLTLFSSEIILLQDSCFVRGNVQTHQSK